MIHGVIIMYVCVCMCVCVCVCVCVCTCVYACVYMFVYVCMHGQDTSLLLDVSYEHCLTAALSYCHYGMILHRLGTCFSRKLIVCQH